MNGAPTPKANDRHEETDRASNVETLPGGLGEPALGRRGSAFRRTEEQCGSRRAVSAEFEGWSWDAGRFGGVERDGGGEDLVAVGELRGV